MSTTVKMTWFWRSLSSFEKSLTSSLSPPSILVGSEFTVVNALLNSVGTSPPIFHLQDELGRKRYGIKWSSMWTITVALSGIASAITWINYIMDTVFENPFFGEGHSGLLSRMQDAVESNKNLSPRVVVAVLFALRGIFCVVSIGELLGILFGWITADAHVQFLNGFIQFEEAFHQSLTVSASQDVKKLAVPLVSRFQWGKLKMMHLGMIIYVGGPTAAGIIFRIINRQSTLLAFWYCYFVFRFVTVGLLTDIKTIIGYQSVASAFNWVYKSVSRSIASGEMIPGRVNKWRRLIEMARRQSELVCAAQQPSQLLYISRCTMQLSMFAFILLNTSKSDAFSQMFSILWMLYCTMQLVRLNVKIYMAKKVTAAEKMIMEALSTVDTTSMDLATLAEVKFTFDVINQAPTRITYCGFVVMDISLCAGILGQVISYLIVMMQFSQTK